MQRGALVDVELRDPLQKGGKSIRITSLLRNLEADGDKERGLSSLNLQGASLKRTTTLLERAGWDGLPVLFPNAVETKGRDNLIGMLTRGEGGEVRAYFLPERAEVYYGTKVALGIFGSQAPAA